ncbi:N-acetylmuramoyl-L-alanine amidase CwlD [Marinicrinis lubricantis]|uniref:N-acetylmuramoyl-L-alanine amidase CwlD n=1 Tax=Marinicrinis lubricantis TaxID=2086470 RepID=A0ABW1IS61_9BACL
MFGRKKRLVIWIPVASRKKIFLTLAMAAFVIAVFTYKLPTADTWSHWSLPLSGKVIVLDPGHGGKDGGAVSADGTYEEHINLAIAMSLRDYLQEAGAVVYMTRESDTDLADEDNRGSRKTQDLHRRVEFIQKHEADLYVSIHLNSIESPKWSGAQTFYHSSNTGGKELAVMIQNAIKENLQNTTREANTADGKYLLKALDLPGAIVEAGFLSNPQEAALLDDPNYQKKVSAAIYQGILKFASSQSASTP